MLVIDTETLPRRDRADAMAAAMGDATGATSLVHEGPSADAYLRMDLWQLGATALVSAACSGHTQARTQRRPARDDEPIVVVGVQSTGTGAQVQDGVATPLSPGGVYGMVLSGSYRHVSVGRTRTANLLVRAGDLDLPLQLLARARPRLASSPLRDVLAAHVRSLVAAADDLAATSSMDAVEPATLALTRAFLASASGSEAHVQEALAETLVARVRAYVLQHLADRNLSPATIAVAHHVSERQLYKACAAEQLRLEPWIIGRRLEAAHAELATPGGRRSTIAATAARWGFANSSHFTHRFRTAYGMTPREWQQHSHDSAPVQGRATTVR
ncbi:helix-turn-helix domain-containing protein [Nocardioides dongkuii]|uniref:helix-turn-helix domain-containing protein n=1 Tax=Nocardioides dongkuii TaxID=2760089 RepID=UPI0015FBC9CE|nr:helix-turn-helix domain-containing protein [Nocardioides dongkuii]